MISLLRFSRRKDYMLNKELLERVSDLGYSLLAPEQKYNVNKLLADVVKTTDARLWEGFPVLLLNANKREEFNLETTLEYLASSEDKASLGDLLALSLALYRHEGLVFSWADKLYNHFREADKKKVERYHKSLKKYSRVQFDDFSTNLQRLQRALEGGFEQEGKDVKALVLKKEGYSLEYALSQLFSPKQKELFFKKLKGEKMTKTEKEYFSRSVKKKLLALTNSNLHELARNMV